MDKGQTWPDTGDITACDLKLSVAIGICETATSAGWAAMAAATPRARKGDGKNIEPKAYQINLMN